MDNFKEFVQEYRGAIIGGAIAILILLTGLYKRQHINMVNIMAVNIANSNLMHTNNLWQKQFED